MKDKLKRLLPILLAIVVIASIAWYLFVYDRDFTRDMLIDQARYCESQSKHSLAAWFYNLAYIQSGEDDDVAIELAEQLRSIGNYTKAEHTLTRAIADSGSAKLYIALSKLYVEQDKLLDAVTMLNNVADPKIKAQLNELRPAAPTVDREQGFYNQYITVNVSSTSGKLYVTTDKSYPSIENASSDGAVTLVGGENTIYALAVSEDGLVSTLSVFGYTVGGVIEKMTFADQQIDALVRNLLQLSATETLYTNMMWQITELVFPADAQTSADLSYFPYLETLTVEKSLLDSWASLSSLSQLKELTFRDCLLSQEDLLAIASLPNLEKLTLANCGLGDITNLSGATKLTSLKLSDNTIRDLSPLSGMTGLFELDLNHNALEDLGPLSALLTLQTLDVSFNSLTSIAPLVSCTQLYSLDISNNLISSLAGAENMKRLVSLNASYNAIQDVAPINACTALSELNISNNSIADIRSLSSLEALFRFDFSNNNVSALPAWSKDCPLTYLVGSYNKVTSLAGLAGFQNLNSIVMDYNKISSVKELAVNNTLMLVSVYGNPVSNVDALKDLGILVYYTPKK